MIGPLKERAQTLQIEDVEWYLEAYARAAARFALEEKRSGGKNLERRGRHLQVLYDKIVASLEDERTKAAHATAAAIAINHAVSDHGYPREMLRDYTGDKDRDSA